jgi:antitoxin CcdA
MNFPAKTDGVKRATNVSLPVDLVEEAKKLGMNISQACNAGLEAEVRKLRAERWLQDNREALDWSNDYVEKHGLPLASHRMF